MKEFIFFNKLVQWVYAFEPPSFSLRQGSVSAWTVVRLYYSGRLHLLFNVSKCGLDRIQSLTMTVDKMERSDTARRIKRNVG
jgi:hypothetical protein